MSEDDYGLDKAAELAVKNTDEPEAPIKLEPEFPFEFVAFDLQFWKFADKFKRPLHLT